ncbi:glycoprotein [Besnoitia besnoiti]|uniref:Glycoprotein n=1 Tax=Besnoitia besnoiti TaxID=94643 RepID=A0A2A9MLY5_BESBE|nr:glycoprotein [Besnoitia besnoiti]PFH37076.1 glycoprotein [Besnoitia besnoiti]
MAVSSSALFRVFASSKAPLATPFAVTVRQNPKACNVASFSQFSRAQSVRASMAPLAAQGNAQLPALFATSKTWLEGKRGFSSQTGADVAKDLLKTIQSEIQHEQSTYEQDNELTQFIKNSGWTVSESDNNMMVTLQKQVGNKKVLVEFSCVQSAEAPTEEGPVPEMSDFTVTITNPDESGVTFYCSTTQDEEDKFRYCIGQVRFFKNAEEKESLSVYPGPYFEDLDDSFQQGLDDWLAKMGVDPELCDFIDRFSVDKENREYLGWLKKLAHFVEN